MTETPAATVVALSGNRARTVSLEYPAELADGTIISEVTVRRMTSAEVEEFVAAAAGGKEVRLPMFDQPPEVLDALDPDDFEELNRVATEMLPRRIRRALDTVELAPDPISAATGALNDLANSAAALAADPPPATAQS
ncbi:MAG: phage tail assembly protein [Bosea sp.]|uniref:phage tail assembly protein n=1 Tax=Bosea sp. (in: a-proteobacteria) TaxID=1871050 RepID=UPI001AD49314|nr:phage tail assembly protein [Bosea sp. (in: a-proteobacteria)]MBN9452701.1 phage tail assembly protein [Bosea sp. (in: a-proteobacteria)]